MSKALQKQVIRPIYFYRFSLYSPANVNSAAAYQFAQGLISHNSNLTSAMAFRRQ